MRYLTSWYVDMVCQLFLTPSQPLPFKSQIVRICLFHDLKVNLSRLILCNILVIIYHTGVWQLIIKPTFKIFSKRGTRHAPKGISCIFGFQFAVILQPALIAFCKATSIRPHQCVQVDRFNVNTMMFCWNSRRLLDNSRHPDCYLIAILLLFNCLNHVSLC